MAVTTTLPVLLPLYNEWLGSAPLKSSRSGYVTITGEGRRAVFSQPTHLGGFHFLWADPRKTDVRVKFADGTEKLAHSFVLFSHWEDRRERWLGGVGQSATSEDKEDSEGKKTLVMHDWGSPMEAERAQMEKLDASTATEEQLQKKQVWVEATKRHAEAARFFVQCTYYFPYAPPDFVETEGSLFGKRILAAACLAHTFGFRSLFLYYLYYLQQNKYTGQDATALFHYAIAEWPFFFVDRSEMADEHCYAAVQRLREHARDHVMANPDVYLDTRKADTCIILRWVRPEFMKLCLQSEFLAGTEQSLVGILVDWMTLHCTHGSEIRPGEDVLSLFHLVRWHQFDSAGLLDFFNSIMANRQRSLPLGERPKKGTKKKTLAPASPSSLCISERMRQVLTEILLEVMFLKSKSEHPPPLGEEPLEEDDKPMQIEIQPLDGASSSNKRKKSPSGSYGDLLSQLEAEPDLKKQKKHTLKSWHSSIHEDPMCKPRTWPPAELLYVDTKLVQQPLVAK